MLISRSDIYVFVSFDHSIPLFGLISTSLEKRALFWRFHAETLISHWDIYVFVSFDIIAYHYLDSFQLTRKNKPCSEGFMQKCWYPTQIFMFFWSFNRSIPLFRLISTGSEKWALFWRFRAEMLISRWDIYVFGSINHSIPLFGLISTSLEKWALFWRFRAETLISRSDIYVFVSFDCSIPLFGLISTSLKNEPCSEGFMQKRWYPAEIFMFL